MSGNNMEDAVADNLFNWPEAPSIQWGQYPVKEGSLGDVLFKARIISGDDIIAALQEQERSGIRFGEALTGLGIVTQEDIDWALSNQLGIPYIRLEKGMIDPDAIKLVPEDICRSHNLLPLIKAGDELSIAISDPLNKAAIEAVQNATGCKVNTSVSLAREIIEMIDVFYGVQSTSGINFSSSLFSEELVAEIQRDSSCSRLLQELLDYLIRNHLSSLSMQPFPQTITIVGRCSGKSRILGNLARCHYTELSQRLHSLATGTGGRFQQTFHGREIQLQLVAMQGEAGEYLTLRRHVTSSFPSNISELTIPQNQKQLLVLLAQKNKGLFFVASRNRYERCRFMEILLELSETEHRTIIGLGLEPGKSGKRFPRIPLPDKRHDQSRLIIESLSHEPDILLVEDVTYPDSCIAVSRAAMGERSVIAGIDLRGTKTVLEFLIRHRRENPLLTPYLSGIVSFKGIQLLCPDCRHEYQPAEDEYAALAILEAPPTFYRANGCDSCSFTGVGERRFLIDVLVFDEDLRKVFECADTAATVMAHLYGKGYQGADMEGLDLLKQGLVSPEEYIAAVKL